MFSGDGYRGKVPDTKMGRECLGFEGVRADEPARCLIFKFDVPEDVAQLIRKQSDDSPFGH